MSIAILSQRSAIFDVWMAIAGNAIAGKLHYYYYSQQLLNWMTIILPIQTQILTVLRLLNPQTMSFLPPMTGNGNHIPPIKNPDFPGGW